MVGQGPTPTKDDLAPALDYVAAHPAVREVIVSGGDALMLSDERLSELLARVRAIPHVEIVRLATRMLAFAPSRVTDALLATIRPHHPVYVLAHFNHPRELAPAAVAAIERLVDAGVPVLNQTVLLRGVNDSAPALESLFRGLVQSRVRPYYLLQTDPVRGTSHLRTPLARGIELMASLQGRLSGIALPRLIVDSPGGRGKVPVGPDYIVTRDGGLTTLRTFRGELVQYQDPPIDSAP